MEFQNLHGSRGNMAPRRETSSIGGIEIYKRKPRKPKEIDRIQVRSPAARLVFQRSLGKLLDFPGHEIKSQLQAIETLASEDIAVGNVK